MHTNLDRSRVLNGSRRQVAEGLPREVSAICTNRLGRVRMCKQLLTPMNFRKIYLRTDLKLPRNLVMALTVDVSERRLRTLLARDVTTYYYHAAKYLRSSISSLEDELLNSDLAVGWLMNAIQILDQLHLCVGETTVSEAIDEKYGNELRLERGTIGGMLRRTIPYEDGEQGRQDALFHLKRVADIIKPTDVRIWGMDDMCLGEDTPRYSPNVFLGEARSNELRVNPLSDKKSYVQDKTFED